MKSERQRLRVLTGCTAVGKTAAAVRWAEANAAEIISCDALLFYRGMDVGTAKPSAEELARIPHHLVDVLPVAEAMDVQRYGVMALAAAEDIIARGRKVLVVGGSGFYLKTFFGPTHDDVVVPPEIKARVNALLTAGGIDAAVEELLRLNPDVRRSPVGDVGARAEHAPESNDSVRATGQDFGGRSQAAIPEAINPDPNAEAAALNADAFPASGGESPHGGVIDLKNPRRVVRALERCLAAGVGIAELRRRFALRRGVFAEWDVELVEAWVEPDLLARRIRERTRSMIERGLLAETERLRQAGLERNPSARRAIGYRECLQVLDGTLPLSALADAVDASTRALVKKQRTWFRTQLPEHRLARISGLKAPQDLSFTW